MRRLANPPSPTGTPSSESVPVGYKTYTCPVGRSCGGCEWLNVPYPIQLERKHAELERLFEGFGAPVEAVVGMETPLHYRAKIASPFVFGEGGTPRFGMYARGTHEVIEAPSCIVEYEEGRPILESVAELCRRFRIEPYDEDTGRGLLRHVVVRVSRATREAMVTLVVNRKEFPRKKAFVAALRELHPSISTVVFNVNTRQTNAILGPLFMTAYGQGWIEDRACGCTFRIPAGAFYQTNPGQAEVLYRTAVEQARLHEGERVLDAYCGVGAIGVIAAKRSKASLVGVESVEEAVRVARENARANRVEGARFVAGDAGEMLVAEGEGFDAVFLDPPRAGASEQFLDALLAASPRRIVYVSCNPETQVRDVRKLSAAYALERVTPVDMFPHTKHIETVATLSRR